MNNNKKLTYLKKHSYIYVHSHTHSLILYVLAEQRNFVCAHTYSALLCSFFPFHYYYYFRYFCRIQQKLRAWNQWPTKSEQTTNGINDISTTHSFFFVHENNSIRKMLRWSCPCLLLIFHHHFIDVGIIAAVRWNMLSIQLQKNAFIVVLVRFGSSFFFACFVRRCFVLFGSVHVLSSFVQFYNIDQAKLGICHFQYLICVSTICSIVFHAHIKYNLECIWAQKMELVNKTIGLFVENITHCECIKSNRIDPLIRIDLCIIRKNGNGICVKLKRQNN